ncbi:hypothetical protein TCE0_060r18838 [Talaromyces pinophilus]|uniref:N-glycosylation protein EOS1 n=1 Tax=Talaromyces pinophilus TaxID=128442 RepID=A0A6V8HQZ1_TALPI|nr:hypothetical protein TCE0_060r18838 [Talaromyces pinophilus]
MKSLGGTIFPTTTTTQEGIDYDDEDEDSPASTIVPPSPVGSRRNSLMNNGATTEEGEDIITSSGDHLSSSVAYGEYDIDGDDIVNPVNGLHPRPQSQTSHPRPLLSHPKLARGNPRPPAPGTTDSRVHEQRASHQRNPNPHGTTPATTTRGGLFEKVETKLSRLQSSVGATQTPRMEDRAQAPTPTETSAATPTVSASKLHPRVAVILGVDRKWYLPLVVCRAMSVGPALWWGLRCAFTFLAELLRIRPGSMWREGWVAIVVSSAAADWDVERRFRVTEVALAIVWCCASAYLSYFFMDCMMSRWLLNYSPPAVLIRLLATNGLIAYLTSSVLWLSGASSDPRLLLPAWISITTTLTFLYHATQNHAMIKRETTASISVLSVASYVSMSLILLQLHLTRDNEPEVPAFVMGQKVLDWVTGLTSSSS